MKKILVVYHSADFDGIFCREIARKFLENRGSEVRYVGWNFGDAPVVFSPEEKVYVLDLPVDASLGIIVSDIRSIQLVCPHLVWIDHHITSIQSHSSFIPGYRINGVAACRLAWQFFISSAEENSGVEVCVPTISDFKSRLVPEPRAVRLAGEYDIWDKRDPDAELFQFGLRSVPVESLDWSVLLGPTKQANLCINELLNKGRPLQEYRQSENESIILAKGFDLEFEGLTFLACNHAKCNSFLFEKGIKDHHQALLAFSYSGKNREWVISLYAIEGRERDLTPIAKKYTGGGHPGACGFGIKELPFTL